MRSLPLLFWLKWTLMWRAYRRNTLALVGIIISLVIFFPMALGAAGGCLYGYLSFEGEYKEHLLRAVLLFVYASWLLSPILGYALNESYDITRLFVYPLTSRQLFLGVILGSLADFPVLFFLPALLVVPFGFATSPFAVLVALLTIPLFFLHTLSLCQAFLLLGAGFFRSRRFRDLTIVLAPLLGAAVYLCSQLLPHYAFRFDFAAFLHGPVWNMLNLLPSGLAARAVGAASRGEVLPALLSLSGLMGCAVATVYWAGRLIEWIRFSDALSAPAPTRSERAAHPTSRRSDRLPPVVAAMVEKEWKYLFRDPIYKSQLSAMVYMLVMLVVIMRPWSAVARESEFSSAMLWVAVAFLLFTQIGFSFNLLGTEGKAAATLFLFPGSRRQILLGKNLVVFAMRSLFNLVALLVVSLASHQHGQVLLLFAMLELGCVVAIAAGNLVSIWFPMRAVAGGWRMQQQSAGRGCGYLFLIQVLTMATGLLMLPLAAALLLPLFLLPPPWFALTLPLAVAYTAGLYYLSLHIGEKLLQRREIEVAEKLLAEE